MNIALFVIGVDRIGGSEIATFRLAKAFAKRNHRVWVIGSQSVSEWRSHHLLTDYANNITIVRFPVWERTRATFSHTLIAQAKWLFPIFLRKIQVLHLRGFSPETTALARIAHGLGVKVLCVPMASGAYGDVAKYPPNALRSSQVFHQMSAFTPTLKEELITWGFDSDKINIIPNGVDTDFFKPPSVRHNKGIIYVGQFRSEKRIYLLLKAWKIIQNVHPNSTLTLLGGDSNHPEYERLAQQLDVSAKFIANTNADGVLSNLQSNSIFVLPGISEGMSNALLEAMAVGLAPVVSDTPANRAVITDEKNGLSYSADSAEDLASQLLRLLGNDELRNLLGVQARRTVEQRYTLTSVADQYLALYARMLGETDSMPIL